MNYDVYVSEGMCREATMNFLPGQVLTKDTRKFEPTLC
jgi:tyrosinase